MSKSTRIICECSYCNTEIDWENAHETKGSIFYCEKCGKDFCADCWEKKTDKSISKLMEKDDCLCPDCITDSL